MYRSSIYWNTSKNLSFLNDHRCVRFRVIIMEYKTFSVNEFSAFNFHLIQEMATVIKIYYLTK